MAGDKEAQRVRDVLLSVTLKHDQVEHVIAEDFNNMATLAHLSTSTVREVQDFLGFKPATAMKLLDAAKRAAMMEDGGEGDIDAAKSSKARSASSAAATGDGTLGALEEELQLEM